MNGDRHILSSHVAQPNGIVARRTDETVNEADTKDTVLLKQRELELRRFRRNQLRLSETLCPVRSIHGNAVSGRADLSNAAYGIGSKD